MSKKSTPKDTHSKVADQGKQSVNFAPIARAKAKPRHLLILCSYLLCVLLPSIIAGSYLWGRALDQYASHLAFTVRSDTYNAPLDLLGGLGGLRGGSSSDADILFEYIHSQEIVDLVDQRINIRRHFSSQYEQDPLFSLRPDAAIEDLVSYWRSMVGLSYANNTGLIEVRVKAFDPEKAQHIGREIYNASFEMINHLSSIARADAMRYATLDLTTAKQQVTQARQALTAFRSRAQIVDPKADMRVQMGLINTLQQQLGAELISYDLLRDNTRANDTRITQTKHRIDAIRNRIQQERQKIGSGIMDDGSDTFATQIAQFEQLTAEREFAEQQYAAALSALTTARAQAERQSRYLAAYVSPTLAQRPMYPRRALIFGLFHLFVTISWAMVMLTYYSLRDRR